MQETKILAAICRSRRTYERIFQHIEPQTLGASADVICSAIRDYYEKDPQAALVDTEILYKRIIRTIPNPKHHEVFEEMLLKTIPSIDISLINIEREVIDQKIEVAGWDLAAALGNGNTKKIEKALREYERLLELDSLDEPKESYEGMTVKDLLSDKLSRENLIGIAPKELNEKLNGGVLRGNSIIYFSRPELGKTLFAVNCIRGFLHQKLRVLYVGNEDPLAQVLVRVMSSVTGLNRDQLEADPEGAQELLNKSGYDGLVMKELCPGTIPEIRALVREIEPDVLIVDQMRNIAVKADNRVGTLEKAAQEIRNIGKEFNCVTVMLTQAGSTAEDKLYLDMNDIDGSKTGIPAAADVLIGAGADHNFQKANLRMFTLCKNKVSANHSSFQVQIQPMISRIV